MKIKDIINEQGFGSGFVSGVLGGLKPKIFRDIEQTKVGPDLTSAQTAMQAHKEFGDNPESKLPGFLGWLSDQERDELERQAKKVQKQKDKEKIAKGKEKLKKDILGKFDQFGIKSSAATQPPPPQVRLSSGEFITKYGGLWYNEQGQQVTAPSDIASLERRVQKPSGQAQMATTKNVPVNLPGYKGKR